MENQITPICCILGHVDVGKTKLLDYLRKTTTREVSGITQQIGTTYFNSATLEKICGSLAKNLSISGMVMIDTPGHDCFTTMRYVGAIVSHVVILIVDITSGLEKETINCLNFIKKYHNSNFIIAVNKLDKINGWQSVPNASLKKTLDKNKKIIPLLKSYIDKIICELACQGINACLYYDNKDINTYVSMVPISASTGEGIPDLIVLMSKMVDKTKKNIMANPIVNYTFGYFLDNRYEDGTGYFNISINVNGKLANGNEIIIVDRDNRQNVTTKIIKGLVLSQEGKEMKEKSKYMPTLEINGTQGVGITLTEKKFIPSSGSIYAVCDNMTENEKENLAIILQSMIIETESSLMCEYSKKEIGITINAQSMNIISGLIKYFNDKHIPICDHHAGKITKDIITKTNIKISNLCAKYEKMEYLKKYTVILSFNPVLDHDDDEIIKLCKESNIDIITGKTIFELYDKFKKHCDSFDKSFYEKYSNIGEQFKLQILPEYIFLKTTPLMFGIRVCSGSIKIGTMICAIKNEKKIILGSVTSMQKNKKNVETGKINEELCIRIENNQKIIYGEDFDDSYTLIKYMNENEENIKKFIIFVDNQN